MVKTNLITAAMRKSERESKRVSTAVLIERAIIRERDPYHALRLYNSITERESGENPRRNISEIALDCQCFLAVEDAVRDCDKKGDKKNAKYFFGRMQEYFGKHGHDSMEKVLDELKEDIPYLK